MATDITGGNNQVGTSNRQFINSNNNLTINMNFHVNCTEGHSIPGEEIHQAIDFLQKIAATHPNSEATIKYPFGHQRLMESDSVRIMDSNDEVLKPGDGVLIDYDSCISSLYIGDGYVVYYQDSSEAVVKEELDISCSFYTSTEVHNGNVNVYSPERRVQRALQQVDRPCPVPGGNDLDFVFWTFTGLGLKQSDKRGFDLSI